MPKLTVVFNYPDKDTMLGARRAFVEQGKTGAIPNLVGTAGYDAIDKCGGYEKQKEESELDKTISGAAVKDSLIDKNKSNDEISGD